MPGNLGSSLAEPDGIDSTVGEILHQLVPTFKLCALQAMREVLGMPVVAGSGWLPTPDFSMVIETGGAVGFTSARWQCQCLVSAENRLRRELRPDFSNEIWIDALGEVANTICGILQGRPEFQEVFGHLLQTPPVGFLDGRFRFRDWTLVGPVLTSKGGSAIFVFGVRHMKPHS